MASARDCMNGVSAKLVKRRIAAGVFACTALTFSGEAMAQAQMWQGFYLGANVGYGWGTIDWSTNTAIPITLPAGTAVNHMARGWLGGGHLGYNIALGRHWLVGIDAAFDWSSLEGGSSYTNSVRAGSIVFTDNISMQSRINSLSSAAARLGFAHGDWLFYGRLGIAWAGVEASINGASTVRTETLGAAATPVGFVTNWSSKELHTGWTAGLGFDRKLNMNWSFGVAYDYYDFRSATHVANLTTVASTGQSATTPTSIAVDPAVHAVTARLTYQFHRVDPAPAPMK